MSLTKVSYSMITGAPVNVFDYMTQAEITAVVNRTGLVDVTTAIQTAFGGAGTTPDNTHVYFPNGLYIVSQPIKIYRSGQTLRNVSLIGESVEGVLIKYGTGPGNLGIVIGEPALSDNLQWGTNSNNPALATYTENVEVRNIGHDFPNLGLWFVYCKNVLVDTIYGYSLLCVAAGNDSVDDCFDVRINNVTRMGNGRDMTPDAWYSIGLFRVQSFSVTNYFSEFYPAAFNTGGTHIFTATCNRGVIANNVIAQPAQGNSRGIVLETATTNVIVANNSINLCGTGIITFGTANNYNTITGNKVVLCNTGMEIQAPISLFTNNYIHNSITTDLSFPNADGVNNRFFANLFTTYTSSAGIFSNQSFISNIGAGIATFVPATQFVVSGAALVFDAQYALTNTGGSISAISTIITGGRGGTVPSVTFYYTRLIASTAIVLTVDIVSATGTFNIGTYTDTSATLGAKTHTIVPDPVYSTITSGATLVIGYSSGTASVSTFKGAIYVLKETGLTTLV